jgi:catalase
VVHATRSTDTSVEPTGRQLVDATKLAFPHWRPGTRAAHSHGIGATGWFQASDVGSQRCAAKHFSGERIPVLVRFSNGSGERRQADRATDARGLAVKFFAGTSDETDLIAMSMPVFFVRTPADFLEFSKIAVPVPAATPSRWQVLRNLLRLTPTAKRNPYSTPLAPSSKALMAWADEHPESKSAIAAMGGLVTPTSYARCAYFGVHTFVLRDRDGRATNVRFSWLPVQGVRPADRTTAGLPENYLHHELRSRLARGPFELTLQFLVAEDGDAIDDPTVALDHSHRPRLIGGRLVVTGLYEGGDGCEPLAFDPCRLIDGIEASGDRILTARGRLAYPVSATDRGATDPL